jgi:DNA-binding protein HU-beta
MTKTELIDNIAEDAEISKKEAEAALNSVTTRISSALAGGSKVTLTGFGTFSTSARAARTGRNPQTGAAIQIAASTGVKFKAGKTLKDSVQ